MQRITGHHRHILRGGAQLGRRPAVRAQSHRTETMNTNTRRSTHHLALASYQLLLQFGEALGHDVPKGIRIIRILLDRNRRSKNIRREITRPQTPRKSIQSIRQRRQLLQLGVINLFPPKKKKERWPIVVTLNTDIDKHPIQSTHLSQPFLILQRTRISLW